MLRRLFVKNFVLVEQLELDFQPGFVVLSGMTGAGKSLLVDTLAFLLGGRADGGVIRQGQERTEVAAEFSLTPQVSDWLAQESFTSEGDGCLLRRVLEAGNRSKGYICGAPATVGQLRALGELLVDIQGQHEHHLLLKADVQRELLDEWAGASDIAKAVREHYRVLHEAREAREALERNAEAVAREREMLEWQVEELAQLAFRHDTWSTLQQNHKRLGHHVLLAESVAEAQEYLEHSALQQAMHALKNALPFDNALKDSVIALEGAILQMEEAVRSLRHYQQALGDADGEELAALDQKIAAVLAVARKHKVPAESLPDVEAQLSARLTLLQESADPVLSRKKEQEAAAAFQVAAGKLSALRRKAAAVMGKQVSERMAPLAMKGGRLEVKLIPVESATTYGLEKIEFLITPHEGQPLVSLAKTVSGGELSRIGLAVTMANYGIAVSTAANKRQRPTLVFDEVDVGIGGDVAQKVGEMLASLGQGGQVLCVTHSPQIAALANWHYLAVKGEGKSGEIVSKIHSLNGQERVQEIARLLGDVKKETVLLHARELLGARALS